MTSGRPKQSPRTTRVKSVDQSKTATDTDSEHGKTSTTSPKSKSTNNNNKHARTSSFGRRRKSSKANKPHDHNDRLRRVMAKQTLLFLISVISSFGFWIFGALFFQVSLLITIDTVINAICIWFMFRFADDLLHNIMHFCDCCCCCCGDLKDDLLVRMNTLSRAMSLRSIGESHATHTNTKSNGKSTGLTPVLTSASTDEQNNVANYHHDGRMERLGSGHDPILPTQGTDR